MNYAHPVLLYTTIYTPPKSGSFMFVCSRLETTLRHRLRTKSSQRNESMLICEDYIEHILYISVHRWVSFPLLCFTLYYLRFLIVRMWVWKCISLLYARIQQVKSRQSCNYIFISTWFIFLSLSHVSLFPFSARSNYIFHTLVMPPIDQQQQLDMG